MALFGRRREVPNSADEVVGLAALAASRGWQPAGEEPVPASLTDLVHHASWSLYDRNYWSVYDVTSAQQRTFYRDAYRGNVGTRGLVIANAWTNIGPQDVVRLLQAVGVAVCAVELGTIPPIMVLQPRHLPPLMRIVTAPIGSAGFDEKYSVVLAPGTDASVLNNDVQQRLQAHDDWAFVADGTWLACLGKGAFTSADDVSRRLDEMLGIIAGFPATAVPTEIDRSVDDLAVRIEKLDSIEDALAFLETLSPTDRERLANSNTPLAAFADVKTPEEAFARFEALDTQARVQLLGMFQRVDGQ
jgi:hypothetical protein